MLFSPQDLEKKLDFSTLSTCKRRPCCPCNLSVEKYCKRSNQGAASMGISAGSLSDCLQTDIVSGKYHLLFASAEEALAKSFLEVLKREGNSHLVISSRGILTRTFSDSVLKTTLTWRPPSGRLGTLRNDDVAEVYVVGSPMEPSTF